MDDDTNFVMILLRKYRYSLIQRIFDAWRLDMNAERCNTAVTKLFKNLLLVLFNYNEVNLDFCKS